MTDSGDAGGTPDGPGVSDRAPKEPSSLDAIEIRLRRDLLAVQKELDTLTSGDGGHPGDEADASFDAHVARIESTIGDLHRALERLSKVRAVDLTRVASWALSELLLQLEKPLVLSVSWDADLPVLRIADEALSSIVARMMSLVARYVDPGDEVALSTLCEDGQVVLRIVVTPFEPWSRSGRGDDFRLRCRSLVDFVEEIEGRFVLSDEERVQLDLRFTADSPVA